MKQFKVHPVTSIFADVNADLEQITSKGRWSNAQKVELRKGLEQGVDVSEYANPRMNAKKMRCIRLYLLSGKTLDLNALIKMADYQLDEIDKGLESGVDVSDYVDSRHEPKGRGSKPTSTSRKKRPDPFQQYVDKQGRSWTGEKL